MKVTKRHLRRIIREEKTRLLSEIRPPFKGGYQHEEPDNSEVKPTPGGYTPSGPRYAGDYAIGAYFNANMMKQFTKLQHDMFEDAMGAAQADGLEPDEAYDEVMAAFETLIEKAQSDMRF